MTRATLRPGLNLDDTFVATFAAAHGIRGLAL
jgi:hypothetical protein